MGRPDSAFAVIRRRGRVLLVQTRRDRRWNLPGGAIERGEGPRRAARREIEEETGLAARIGGLAARHERHDGSYAYIFLAHVPRRARCAGPRHEIRRQRWMSLRKAFRALPRNARRRLRRALTG